MASNELEKIISEGKVTTETAMVVFAMELKTQGEKLQDLKDAIGEDNKRYATKEELQNVKDDVSWIKKGIAGFLVSTLLAVLGFILVNSRGGG